MSDAGKKPLSTTQSPLPEGAGIGKPDSIERRPRDLTRTLRQMANRLRRDFAAQIAADARQFKKRVVHDLRRCLPPHPGRPPEASLTKAAELHKRGMEWKAIHPQCISDHAKMPPAVRRQAESNLRAACRSRRNAVKRRRAQARITAKRGDDTRLTDDL